MQCACIWITSMSLCAPLQAAPTPAVRAPRPSHHGPRTTARRSAAPRAAAPGMEDLLREAAADPELVDEAVVWAYQHGLVYGAGLADPDCAVVHAPLALLPARLPARAFLAAKAAATAFNELVDAVAADGAYLQRVLAPAAAHDEFTARLLALHQRTENVRAARVGDERVLAVLRCDYMLHGPTDSLLQVEVNTIASSFGCLATLVSRLHRQLLLRAGAAPAQLDAALPENNAMDEIADAIAAAAAEYGVPGAAVLVVVQAGERNAFDQQWLQARLWERHGLRTLRRTLAQVAAQGRLGPGGQLQLSGAPIAVAYFRAGYTPADHPSEAEWDARLLVERSDAYACPSVPYQLAGAKKVQQDLAAPGVLERYAGTAERAALLRAFFAGLWGLDDQTDPATAAVLADAAANPAGYVLKPQREGGGNNLYGGALAARLAEGGPGLAAYILMQRILPPRTRSVMVRLGHGTELDALSELGIFGTYVRRGPRVLVNREAGHLVRTKAATSDEGGVAAGFAVLDSPWLG